MGERARVLFLGLIMAFVALTVGATSISVLYHTAFEQLRLRLTDLVQGQARLLEAIARQDVTREAQTGASPASLADAAIVLIRDAHAHFERRSLGHSGEFTLARRAPDGTIVYVMHRDDAAREQPLKLPPDSNLGEPMRRALAGLSGTTVSRDYRGVVVLAAYEPVPALGLGLVAKIDLEEAREPFVRAALTALVAASVVIGGGILLLMLGSAPILRRMRETENRYHELFDNMGTGVAVYEAGADGSTFVFKDFNRAGEQSEGLGRQEVIGRTLTDVFPGADAFGLPEVLRRVWQTGVPERVPARLYQDAQRCAWRENYVYKLPNGDVVALFKDVSEQQQAERALRASEARFRGTFDNAAVGMAHVGMNGTWLRVNERLCEIVGYSREELLQKTFQDITHPDDLEKHLRQAAALLRGAIATYTLENRYLHKHGHVVWVTLTVALQRDATGRPQYFLPVIEDIGARKRAESALRENELRMRALLDASQDEILLLSTQGTILAINKAAERRLASRAAGTDPVGMPLVRLLPEAAARERLEVVTRVAASATLAHYEQQIRGKWFEFWFYPVIAPGRTVTEVAVYARDITEKRQGEAELRKLSQAIDQSPVSVVITDADGTIEYVNPKFTEVTGYTPEDAIGRNPRILKSGGTPEWVYRELWGTIAAGRVWTGELHNRKKNGDLFWELASIAPVRGDDGTISEFVAVKEDITQRKELEDQLRQAQKMQAIGQLTGGIAHDFNNLLAIIIGNLQLLQERLPSDPRTAEMTDDALWSARRAAELTHRLLAFARRQPLNPTVTDLNAVLPSIADLLRRTLGSGIEVRESREERTWDAFVDRGELERAVVNLAFNSRDAMPRGGVLTIEAHNETLTRPIVDTCGEVLPGDYIVLSVSDTGTGMPPEVVKRAFDPFFTTKEFGKGSGLGLSMVYGFVKQSGGHVSCRSAVNRGTTISLYLPRARAALLRDRSPAPAAQLLARWVVLVVEGDEALRAVAATMLKGLGLRAVEAATATEALKRLETVGRVDLLFTELELPGGLSGTRLAAMVCELHPEMQVLFATGRVADVPFHDLQGWPLIGKPYRRDELARCIRLLRDRREAQTSGASAPTVAAAG